MDTDALSTAEILALLRLRYSEDELAKLLYDLWVQSINKDEVKK
jgi:hypothetical protein